ncbi:MAG: hypothetical protein GXO80_03070 [Chlorobi bacterium]|nr:hypothetical protein [Chlorobiota bacterium]
MKTTIISLILLLLLSCRESSDIKKYILYPDSTNYEYKLLKNGLLKVIRFFPETKDTNVIYFLDTKRKIKDSTLTYFTKERKIKYRTTYRANMKIRIFAYYYDNGKIKGKKEINDIKHRITKTTYYKNGKIKNISEIIKYKGKEYGNTKRVYYKNGKINRDSSFYAELITEKDTISIEDSLVIKFKIIGPQKGFYVPYLGTTEAFLRKTDYKNVKYIRTNGYFVFKPKHYGKNKVSIIFELYSSEKPNSFFYKSLKEKTIYVKR